MTTSPSSSLFEQNQLEPEQKQQPHANNSDLHPGEQQAEHHRDQNRLAPATSSAQGAQQTRRSPFQVATVEMIFQLQPEDGHPDGRHIRYALTIGGKTLVIGARRTSVLFAQLAEWADESAEQVLAHLEQYVTACQQRLQRALPQKSASFQAERCPQPEQTNRAAHDVSPAVSASQSVLANTQEKPQQLELF
jgi:hypothetical protein